MESSSPWTVRRIGNTQLSIFVMDRWDGEPCNCASQEHDEVRWVPLDQLSDLPFADPSLPQLLTRALMDQSPDGLKFDAMLHDRPAELTCRDRTTRLWLLTIDLQDCPFCE
jgi:hypothetical protein